MKLATFLLAGLLGVSSLAAADDAPPPPPALRQALLQQFDANGNGRLEPRERKQARRALRRLAKQLGKRRARGARRAALIRKYDLDGDGNLGPGELPPRVQQRLRRYDRNQDGWVDQRDQGDQSGQVAPGAPANDQ